MALSRLQPITEIRSADRQTSDLTAGPAILVKGLRAWQGRRALGQNGDTGRPRLRLDRDMQFGAGASVQYFDRVQHGFQSVNQARRRCDGRFTQRRFAQRLIACLS